MRLAIAYDSNLLLIFFENCHRECVYSRVGGIKVQDVIKALCCIVPFMDVLVTDHQERATGSYANEL